MNSRAHERAEDDDPGAGRHPEDRPRRDVQVVERDCGPALSKEEGDEARERDREQRRATSVASFGTGRKLIERIGRADEKDGKDPAEVVDRIGRLVHVSGDERPGQEQRDGDERQRERGRPSPSQKNSSRAPASKRPERRDGAAERPTRARSTSSARAPTRGR